MGADGSARSCAGDLGEDCWALMRALGTALEFANEGVSELACRDDDRAEWDAVQECEVQGERVGVLCDVIDMARARINARCAGRSGASAGRSSLSVPPPLRLLCVVTSIGVPSVRSSCGFCATTIGESAAREPQPSAPSCPAPTRLAFSASRLRSRSPASPPTAPAV